MAELRLDGCRCEPLAGYLKAIGLLRLVAEQADSGVRGCWRGDTFSLDTELTMDGLVDFLVHRYVPTPIITPWNKGSGFGRDDASKSPAAFDAVSVVCLSDSPRLAIYRTAIESAMVLSQSDTWDSLEKPDQVALCRGSLPDPCVEWIDAAVVITSDSRVFPPLLGTGGNDGRMDFGSNFMQRLASVLDLGRKRLGPAVVEALAHDALSGAGQGRLEVGAIGQFDPAAAGGQRSAPDGAAASLLNPWDFILLFEGAVAFASGVARRFGSSSARSAMPFTVGGVSAGYGSAADENSRGEFWAPVWRRSASAGEVLRLIGEGRAEYDGRQARTAVDVARALGSLGVDRGIDEFVRYGFLERNGLSTFCVPVGRLKVGHHEAVRVLGDLDQWINSIRAMPSRSASATALLRSVDSHNISISQGGDPEELQDLLYDASCLERLARRSRAMSEKVRPLRGLDADLWVPLLDDGSAEFAVAVALASFRPPRSSVGWIRSLVMPDAVKSQRPAVDGFGQRALRKVLAACLVQIAARTPRGTGDPGSAWCGPSSAIWCREADFVEFANEHCDDARIERLLAGLMLLDWSYCEWRAAAVLHPPVHLNRVPTELALLKPLFHHRGLGASLDHGRSMRPDRSMARLLAADQVDSAVRLAIRDVRVAGCRPFVSPEVFASHHGGESFAAAALVPVSDSTALRLLTRVAVVGGSYRKEESA